MVELDGEVIKLHSVWDRLPGRNKEQSDIQYEADRLTGKYKPGKFKQVADLDPLNWSLESNSLAFKYAYQKGKLARIYSVENSPVLSKSYMKKAKKIADKQMTLAGYRLAGILNKCLK